MLADYYYFFFFFFGSLAYKIQYNVFGNGESLRNLSNDLLNTKSKNSPRVEINKSKDGRRSSKIVTNI